MSKSISIHPLDGSSFNVEFNPPITCLSLKHKIEQFKGWNKYQQILWSFEKELKNDTNVEEEELYLELRNFKIFTDNIELSSISNLWCQQPTIGRQYVMKTYGHISIWKFSPLVTDMSYLFSGNNYSYFDKEGNIKQGGFNEDISRWDTRYIVNMSHMFKDNKSFNQDIGRWNVSRVKNIDYILLGADSFKYPLDKWDVSSLETACFSFKKLDMKGQNLSSWCPSRLWMADGMFSHCQNLSMDLSGWVLPLNSATRNMFRGVKIDSISKPRKLNSRGRKTLLYQKTNVNV